MQFSALFSFVIWHILLKFCIWFCFNVLQIKIEYHHSVSIFEGVMSLFELRLWEIHSFPQFSPSCWHIELKFCTWLCFDFFQCTSGQVRVSSLCISFWRSYASLWTSNIVNVQFSALFSFVIWHILLKFCIWFCFDVLQIKFEYRHFASIFEGVMSLFELRLWEIHSFPQFSPSCSDILSHNFAHAFVLMY